MNLFISNENNEGKQFFKTIRHLQNTMLFRNRSVKKNKTIIVRFVVPITSLEFIYRRICNLSLTGRRFYDKKLTSHEVYFLVS